jgi:hypothetical protein
MYESRVLQPSGADRSTVGDQAFSIWAAVLSVGDYTLDYFRAAALGGTIVG